MKNNLTDSELRTLWKYKDLSPKKMVLVLSQLEGCEYHEMRDRLESLGIIGEGEYVKYHRRKNGEDCLHEDRNWYGADELREIFRMRDKGHTLEQIAAALGRSSGSIASCISRNRGKFHESRK